MTYLIYSLTFYDISFFVAGNKCPRAFKLFSLFGFPELLVSKNNLFKVQHEIIKNCSERDFGFFFRGHPVYLLFPTSPLLIAFVVELVLRASNYQGFKSSICSSHGLNWSYTEKNFPYALPKSSFQLKLIIPLLLVVDMAKTSSLPRHKACFYVSL